MYTAKVYDRAVQWRRGWNLTPYKKVGCADWILSGRLSCYSGNIAGDISYIIKNGLAGIILASPHNGLDNGIRYASLPASSSSNTLYATLPTKVFGRFSLNSIRDGIANLATCFLQ